MNTTYPLGIYLKHLNNLFFYIKQKNITLVPTRIIIASAFNILDPIILNNKSLFEIANPNNTNDAEDIIEAKNWIASTTKKSIKKESRKKS